MESSFFAVLSVSREMHRECRRLSAKIRELFTSHGKQSRKHGCRRRQPRNPFAI
jgi:hypothetical protein